MPEKFHKVTISDEERSYLKNIVSKGRVAAWKRLRAQVLLKSDQSAGCPAWSDKKISEAFDVSVPTIERLRKTCVLEGIETALSRKKRSKPPNLKFDGEKEARLIALCCSPPPEGREHCTLQLLADKLMELEVFESVSHEAVRQCLKKTNLSLG